MPRTPHRDQRRRSARAMAASRWLGPVVGSGDEMGAAEQCPRVGFVGTDGVREVPGLGGERERSAGVEGDPNRVPEFLDPQRDLGRGAGARCRRQAGLDRVTRALGVAALPAQPGSEQVDLGHRAGHGEPVERLGSQIELTGPEERVDRLEQRGRRRRSRRGCSRPRRGDGGPGPTELRSGERRPRPNTVLRVALRPRASGTRPRRGRVASRGRRARVDGWRHRPGTRQLPTAGGDRRRCVGPSR